MNKLDLFFTENPEIFARRYIDYLKEVISRIDVGAIGRLVEKLLEARRCGATVFFIGNGGSAATASHFANDISFGTKDYEQPFRVMSLTDNIAVITALSNDFGYEEVFVRQLKVHARRGDLVVGISASGNSENLIKAFMYAHEVGISTFSITGFDGGKLKSLAQDGIHVMTESGEYGPAEDAHMVLDHLVGAYLMRAIRNIDGVDSTQ